MMSGTLSCSDMEFCANNSLNVRGNVGNSSVMDGALLCHGMGFCLTNFIMDWTLFAMVVVAGEPFLRASLNSNILRSERKSWASAL